jgi:hypothetical protein
MVNDGFCDICDTFQGHEDLKTLSGVFFCSDCRDVWQKLHRQVKIDQFKKMLGKE